MRKQMTYNWGKELKDYTYSLKKLLFLFVIFGVSLVGICLIKELFISIEPTNQWVHAMLWMVGLTGNYIPWITGIEILLVFIVVYYFLQLLRLEKPITVKQSQRLEFLALDLAKNGNTKLVEEIKKIRETQKEIQGYQYEILMNDFI